MQTIILQISDIGQWKQKAFKLLLTAVFLVFQTEADAISCKVHNRG